MFGEDREGSRSHYAGVNELVKVSNNRTTNVRLPVLVASAIAFAPAILLGVGLPAIANELRLVRLSRFVALVLVLSGAFRILLLEVVRVRRRFIPLALASTLASASFLVFVRITSDGCDRGSPKALNVQGDVPQTNPYVVSVECGPVIAALLGNGIISSVTASGLLAEMSQGNKVPPGNVRGGLQVQESM